MKPFSSFGDNLRYTDILQLDGVFSTAHINYGRSPELSGHDGRRLAHGSQATSVSGHRDRQCRRHSGKYVILVREKTFRHQRNVLNGRN